EQVLPVLFHASDNDGLLLVLRFHNLPALHRTGHDRRLREFRRHWKATGHCLL
ncbi:hypothetical protein IscW_ISCW011178, partial [Ixodes scapularis]